MTDTLIFQLYYSNIHQLWYCWSFSWCARHLVCNTYVSRWIGVEALAAMPLS